MGTQWFGPQWQLNQLIERARSTGWPLALAVGGANRSDLTLQYASPMVCPGVLISNNAADRGSVTGGLPRRHHGPVGELRGCSIEFGRIGQGMCHTPLGKGLPSSNDRLPAVCLSGTK